MMRRELLAAAVVCCAAGWAVADVTFVSLTGHTHYQGLIGGGADLIQWNVTEPFDFAAPALPTNGGPSFSGGFGHQGNVNGLPFAGVIHESVRATAAYTFNRERGFAVSLGASAAADSQGSGVVVEAGSTDYSYRYTFTTSAPAAFRIEVGGTFAGVFNQAYFYTVNGPIAFWTLFSPDGPQTHDVSGVLPAGTHVLIVEGGASVGLNEARSTGAEVRLTVGNACPADFNNDGFLDFFDYDDFVSAFESGDPDADVNNDGFLDFFDYDDFVTIFERGC